MINRTIIESLNISLDSDRLSVVPIQAEYAHLLFAARQDEAIYHWISSTPPTSVKKLEEQWSWGLCLVICCLRI